MGPVDSTKKKTASTRASVAEHIAVEASSLARLAKHNDFALLAYIIDMAALEAWREAADAGLTQAAGEDPPHAEGGR